MTSVFQDCELEQWLHARALVEVFELDLYRDHIRCHEMARAVGRLLKLGFSDGLFFLLPHSWLWTTDDQGLDTNHILDVMTPGRVPAVQLIDFAAHALPDRATYRAGDFRDDIDYETVERLVSMGTYFIEKGLFDEITKEQRSYPGY